MNRCIGIICSSLLGKDSADFGRSVGYPPPWTVLDAAVYLGKHGIGLGVGIAEAEDLDGPCEMVVDPFDFPMGCLAIVKSGNGNVVDITRAGGSFRVPILHAMLYQEGRWLNPVADGLLVPAEPPVGIEQLWPIYRVIPERSDEE